MSQNEESVSETYRNSAAPEEETCNHYGCSREPWSNGLCEIHIANP